MSVLTLARWQFAITTVYHFFFVPLTLGLSIFIAIMETAYVKTGNEKYKKMAKFWGKLFLINFAMGVVTGIVQEFQFGMNWSEYSRFVGDIFGAPLAVEALLAFYLESTFIGVWVFGWDKLSKGVHLASAWLFAIGSNLSALWILIANSFMQEPVGFVLRNGRAEMTNFFSLLFNPHVWVQFPHVFFSGVTQAAFFVLGISAYHLWKKKDDLEVFQTSFKWAAVYGIIGTVLVILVGHTQAQHMVKVQPMKMAAAEALWNSENPAAMSLFTIGNEAERKDVFAIKIPGLLSFLAHNSFSGEVKGINQIQEEYAQKYADKYGPDANYVPPVALSYWMFRIMVGFGFLMLIMVIGALLRANKENWEFTHGKMKWYLYGIFFPLIAISTGWIFTEVARQPWVVFGVMRVEEAVSLATSAFEVGLTVVLYTVVYGALMVADIYLLKKYAVLGTAGIKEEA